MPSSAATSGWQCWGCLSIDCWTHICFSWNWTKRYFQGWPCAIGFCLWLKQNDKLVFFCLVHCRLLHPFELTGQGAVGTNWSTGCLNVFRDGASISFQSSLWTAGNSHFQDDLTQVARGGCRNSTFGGIQSLQRNGPVKSVYFALLSRLWSTECRYSLIFSYIGVCFKLLGIFKFSWQYSIIKNWLMRTWEQWKQSLPSENYARFMKLSFHFENFGSNPALLRTTWGKNWLDKLLCLFFSFYMKEKRKYI